jgi:hypothetical protein
VVLENVVRGSSEPSGDSSQQIQVDRILGAPKRHLSDSDVLRSSRKALHGDEILATDDAKSRPGRECPVTRSIDPGL